MHYNDIIDFWFEKLTPNEWYQKSDQLDLSMIEKFIAIHDCAVKGELAHWRSDIMGRLAEILLIDQFSRNIYRDDPKSYQHDTTALVLAQEAIDIHQAGKLKPIFKQFIYMPFMHSESRVIHERALQLFSEQGLEHNLEYEVAHKKVIDRFGRYPHRNRIIGRVSTAEEEEFLKKNPLGY